MTAIVALVLALGVAAPQAQDVRAEAERLAATGAYEEALKRFQSLVAANPDDVAARMWIGRLHLRMGQPRRAAAVFESIIATDGQNIEALSGLGVALVDAGEWSRAADVLDRAEALAPDRIEVLTAQGRLHAANARPTLALAYYGRALASEPDNLEIRTLSDSLRATRAHRVTAGYNFQRFDPSIGDFNSGFISVNGRISDALRVFALAEVLSRGDDEARGGGGVEWRPHRTIQLRGGAFFGGTIWLPDTDVFGEATLFGRRARLTATVRYFEFEGADLWIAGPGVEFDVDPRLTLSGQYMRGRSGFATAGSITSDTVVVGVHGRPAERVGAFVEYRHGIDRLDWLTADRLTAEGADTFGLGGSIDFTPFVGLEAGYDHQERSGTGSINRARALLTVRF
jgi:tetratricopeptide (TPR) repeat protein